MSETCKVEEENKRLTEENKRVWGMYYDSKIALAELKSQLVLQSVIASKGRFNVKLELPLCFRILMRLYKGEFHVCFDKGELVFRIGTYWFRSFEQ